MKTQFDSKVRVVSLENLAAMCVHISSTCHTYAISKVTRSRVHVEYSNPDEYGHERPMTAVFPCYPGFDGDDDNPSVVLTYLRIVNDDMGGEGWQSFESLRDCPELFRHPTSGKWIAYPLEMELRQIESALADTPILANHAPVPFGQIREAVSDLRSACDFSLKAERAARE